MGKEHLSSLIPRFFRSILLKTLFSVLFFVGAHGTAAAFEATCLIEWVGSTSAETGVPRPVDNVRVGEVFSVNVQTGRISGSGAVWLNPALVRRGLTISEGPKPTMFFFGRDFIEDPVFMVVETWRTEPAKPFLVYDSGLHYTGTCKP